MKITIDCSIGDFIDRFSILQIKKDNGLDVDIEYNKYVSHELLSNEGFNYFFNILVSIHRQLWDLEDRKRKHVQRYSRQESDVCFMITRFNDLRHHVKKDIDSFFNSEFTERKSH
jgi:hypothetical protein